MDFTEWFTFTSPKKHARQMKEYETWCFPYGEKQIAVIDRLLGDLFPQEELPYAKMIYLTARDLYRDRKEELEEDPQTRRTAMRTRLQGILRGSREGEVFLFEALVLADAEISDPEQYPDSETIRNRAEEIEREFPLKKHGLAKGLGSLGHKNR